MSLSQPWHPFNHIFSPFSFKEGKRNREVVVEFSYVNHHKTIPARLRRSPRVTRVVCRDLCPHDACLSRYQLLCLQQPLRPAVCGPPPCLPKPAARGGRARSLSWDLLCFLSTSPWLAACTVVTQKTVPRLDVAPQCSSAVVHPFLTTKASQSSPHLHHQEKNGLSCPTTAG